jgi:dimethylhistidine N-methyltransferase
MLKTTTVENTLSEFAADVREGLSRDGQKEIPSKYLYDDLGSMLFEAITLVPEYGPTNADERLLCDNAADIADSLPDSIVAIELGAGSGRKTRWLLEELARREPTTYFPIDISQAAVEQCQKEMEAIADLTVHGIASTYMPGLQQAAQSRSEGDHLLTMFLGSTIGNFKPEEADKFVGDVRAQLEPGDSFLLSTDLIKPVRQILEAYDDPTGVTSAFNINLLVRMNRELGADFDLSQFEHLALYNHERKRVEMHLLSLEEQTVTIPEADLTITLDRDETILTESSHKFTVEDVVEMAGRAGFRCHNQWVDEEWPFAQSLLVAV